MPSACLESSKVKRSEICGLAVRRGRLRRGASVAGWGLGAVLLLCQATSAGDDGAAGAGMNVAAPGALAEALLFYGVAAVTVVAVLGICIGKNIVRMAVWLFLALGSVAMVYFLLAATFIAAIQLIVYAGGTLLLLVFGVMLTSKSPWVRFDAAKIELAAGGVVSIGLLLTLCVVLYRAAWPGADAAVPGATVADLGRRLLTVYLVPFEVAGVLLMIVMVGAAHLARQER